MESIAQNNSKKDMHINLANEREIWNKLLINRFISIHEKCIYCNTWLIKTRNSNSIINPILGKCNDYKCNRESILYTILELWLLEEKNGTQIILKLKELYNQTTIDKKYFC